MKITRIRIRNYRGIEQLDEVIPPKGATIRGKTAGGKTSVLKGIRAALAGSDIGPDAIRNGADKAEIIIDMDEVTARRTITSKASAVTVSLPNGLEPKRPHSFLADLLGTSPLDPLDLFLKKPSDRRATILEALPVKVTREQLMKFSEVPEEFSCEGHGLLVVERLHKLVYERRTIANKEATTRTGTAKRLREEADAAPSVEGAPELSAAEAALASAKEEIVRINERVRASAKREASLADTKKLIEAKRVEATQYREDAAFKKVPEGDLQKAVEALEAAKRAREAAQEAEKKAYADVSELTVRTAQAKDLTALAALRDQEISLLVAVAESDAGAAVFPEDMEKAGEAIRVAESLVRDARAADLKRDMSEKADEADLEARSAEEAAKKLDGWVKALAKDAPAALLASCDAMPGLTVDEDDVCMNGVRVGSLSGGEQMRFAVDLARRLNAKVKILIVDGLERLDPDAQDEFVKLATADGWQLLATVVARGERVFAAIEAGEDEQAAE